MTCTPIGVPKGTDGLATQASARKAKAGTAKKTKTVKTAEKKSQKKILVIVESPAKAKTIERHLGKQYTVRASMGHLRDLPKSQFGIDVEHNFEPKYINVRGKGDLIRTLKKEAKDADKIYLASDPDREGEAIAWHLAHILGVDPATDCRIVFHEITKPAIEEAVHHPRPIHMAQVDAQQARRMLDRIVGYQLSPLLWRKVRKGLSAGRVQSVTVRLICDREREIEAFQSEEYWTVEAKLKKGKHAFTAEVTHAYGKKLSLHNEAETKTLTDDLAQRSFSVQEVKRSERRKKAAPPFTTSSLQQDAARKLGFTSGRTMMIAQQLYEGVVLGRHGATGLITYMRTDSTRISNLAVDEARSFLSEEYGKEYVPPRPNVYAMGKKAQDAHEAIRPTSILRTPAEVESYLNRDQLRLYTLIWQRFSASQMSAALYDTIAAQIAAGDYRLRAHGSKLKFKGFTAVYVGAETAKKEKDTLLPDLVDGDPLTLGALNPEQHFTEPPPRYNDASIVKALEELGIGRPSTYAPIIETIQKRGYVERREKQFRPTELGFIVTDMLEEHFKNIVDVKFTANLEGELDGVADGSLDKNELLGSFYTPFEQTLKKAEDAIGTVELPEEVTDIPCDKCGRMMVVKQGRFGKFLACPGFPECRNAKPLLRDTGVLCPKCGGRIVERKSRRGRAFFGCDRYPECDYTTWDEPQKETCKTCGAFMQKHRYRTGRAILYCSNEACPSRIGSPIEKELARQKKRAQEALEKTKETDAAAKKPTTKRKKGARKGTHS
ncbi:type I DNA topoisomerase [Selenomonas flueggei]|uniref:DNA topoisomerase 1 n=1 Tax=Selenomonas flueggei ATCC 43531 TaxID=638302 RepID=C4V2Y3_9FIRM|nr:type I DNA topoisomerase [Selenomonas flueggei]EEQ48819.1 DNA topoisomerase I [Selenomonas flueggei ATCC 43531]